MTNYANAQNPGMGQAIAQAQPQIAEVMDRQEHCLSCLESEISTLYSRLDVLLNPVPPATAAKEVNPPRQVRSPLGERIDSHSDRIHEMTVRMREMLDRLAT